MSLIRRTVPFIRCGLFLFSLVLSPVLFSTSPEAVPKEVQQVSPPPAEIKPPKDLNEPLYPLDVNKLEKQNDRFFSELINMLSTLGLIIGFLLLVAWFLKRMMNTRIEQMNVNSKIKIVERRMLSQKSALYLIEIEGRSLLITESQNGNSSALELTPVQEAPEVVPPPSGFRELL